MSTLKLFKAKLRTGKVYRREELSKFTSTIDRHLAECVEDGSLVKLSQGLYYAPKKTSFGIAPPDEDQLVKAFLKDDDYLITSPNLYNALELGSTQLYNSKRIYNHKRHENVKLGNRIYTFIRKQKFPKKLTPEYLVVDLLSNLNTLAEDKNALLSNLQTNLNKYNALKLKSNAKKYGSIFAKKFIYQSLGL